MDVTQAAQDGYEGGDSPYMLSSPADMAWRAGGWCYHHLMGQPIKVTTGRGYKINVETGKGKIVLDFGPNSYIPKRIGGTAPNLDAMLIA